ncbi:MAG: hypothetical protein BA871_13710 [Desulfuromonadales bacterium C00003096]|jgi:sugar lactone lactonase YvrE|nr:MAG: hypothetical protein BA871_13710 [Desulfuromonadales bacterium C00003096]
MKWTKLAFFVLALFLFYNNSLASPIVGMLEQWDTGELGPYDIELRDDGSIWLTYTESYPDGGSENPDIGIVFTIDPETGTVTRYEADFTPARFQTMDRAPDDTFWLTSNHADRNAIVHFNPDAPEEEAQFTAYDLPGSMFSLPAKPFGVSVDQDGKVWFTTWDDPAIGSFDSATASWERFPMPTTGLRQPGPPAEIDFDLDGNVWFTIKAQMPKLGGLGKLDPATGDFDFALGDNFFPMSPAAPHGIKVLHEPHEPPAPTSYPFVWFVDKSANYLVRFDEVPGSPSISLHEMPTALRDSHYFAMDVDGALPHVVWLTTWGFSAIGSYELLTDTFTVLSLPDANPMGITIAPTGEIWWAENGFGRRSGGVGRFTPLPDSDADGIPDPIDTAPAVFSNDYNDGTTLGTILERGDRELSFVELPNPEGVRILASCGGGPDPARITASCALPVTVELDACEEVTLTCGSANVRVHVGPVEVELSEDIVATVPSGTEMTVYEHTEDGFEIENSGEEGTITIDYQGEIIELAPGSSTHIGKLIDIWPHHKPNYIFQLPNGRLVPPFLPIGILSSERFNALRDVDRNSLTFGATGDEDSLNRCIKAPRDLNHDGIKDLKCVFRTNDTGFDVGDTEGILRGQTKDGVPIEARDAVKIIPLDWRKPR